MYSRHRVIAGVCQLACNREVSTEGPCDPEWRATLSILDQVKAMVDDNIHEKP